MKVLKSKSEATEIVVSPPENEASAVEELGWTLDKLTKSLEVKYLGTDSTKQIKVFFYNGTFEHKYFCVFKNYVVYYCLMVPQIIKGNKFYHQLTVCRLPDSVWFKLSNTRKSLALHNFPAVVIEYALKTNVKGITSSTRNTKGGYHMWRYNLFPWAREKGLYTYLWNQFKNISEAPEFIRLVNDKFPIPARGHYNKPGFRTRFIISKKEIKND